MGDLCRGPDLDLDGDLDGGDPDDRRRRRPIRLRMGDRDLLFRLRDDRSGNP